MHRGVECWHVSGRHAIELGQHLASASVHSEDSIAAFVPEPFVSAKIPVNQAAIIHRSEGFDGFASNDFLPMISLGHFGRMHQANQCANRLHFCILDREIDRHRFFEFGVGPASRSKAVGPAEHHEAAAKLFRVTYEHTYLIVTEGGYLVGVNLVPVNGTSAGDIGQNDRIVCLQF